MRFKFIIIFTLLLISCTYIFITQNTTTTINNQIKEGNSQIDLLEKFDYIDGYSCKKVKVISVDGSPGGTYNLEDYVAGVVSGETHILNDETTFKAISIAIRTYTLYVTSNCKYPILNSEANQVMDNPKIVSSKIKKAVASTKGKVLTLNGKLVKSEYDSFYKGYGYYCDYKYCYSKYLRVGNKNTKPTTHKIKVPVTWRNDLSGGHGKGMSQYGAKYLSQKGYNYEQILKYFYAEGTKISTILKPNVDGLSIDSTGYVTRLTRPKRNNSYYYNQETNTASNNALEGDSSWYIAGRANEILKSINSKKFFKYTNDINSYCNIKGFNVSYEYNKPKKGSIISWGKHAAIIENINEDQVEITEAYIGLGYYGIGMSNEILLSNGQFYNATTNLNDRRFNCEQNGSGCFKRSTISISELKNRWGYDFQCYINLIN